MVASVTRITAILLCSKNKLNNGNKIVSTACQTEHLLHEQSGDKPSLMATGRLVDCNEIKAPVVFKALFYLFRYIGYKSNSIPSYFQNHTRTHKVILKTVDRLGNPSWLCGRFLGVFAKLRKTTINFVVSVCPPVRMQQLCYNWKDFHEVLYLGIFHKSVEKILVSLKSDKNNGYVTWRPIYKYDISSIFS